MCEEYICQRCIEHSDTLLKKLMSKLPDYWVTLCWYCKEAQVENWDLVIKANDIVNKVKDIENQLIQHSIRWNLEINDVKDVITGMYQRTTRIQEEESPQWSDTQNNEIYNDKVCTFHF